MVKCYIRYTMTGRYEIQMSLTVAQESLYQMKYIFEQLRNLYTDFSAVFILRVNIKSLVGKLALTYVTGCYTVTLHITEG